MTLDEKVSTETTDSTATNHVTIASGTTVGYGGIIMDHQNLTLVPPLNVRYENHPDYTANITTVTINYNYTTLNPLEEGDLRFGKEPNLIRHMSIMAEDSPLLYPSRFKKHDRKRENFMKRRRKGMSMVSSLWKWYSFQIEDRPLITKVITAGVLVGMGNFASQCIPMVFHTSHESLSPLPSTAAVNWYQIGEFILMGALLQAPITHYYYLYLDEYLPPTPTPWTFTTLIKLMIDQLIFAPAFLAGVFVFLDMMDGLSFTGIWNHLTSDWCTTVITNWKLWVPSTFLNLAFCPPCFRVLFANVIFFIWSIILSTLLVHHSTSKGASAGS